MRKIYSRLLLLASILLFSTCDYNFSEDYFNEIEITDPSISFVLPNFSKDETITKPKYIEYNYSSDKNPLYYINFYIDAEFVSQNQNEKDTFFLDIENLSEGNHTLKIELTIKSNTGSLAELSGGEYYVAEQDFDFTVNKDAEPLIINSVELINGSIKVNFDSYELVNEIESSISPYLNIEADGAYNSIILSKKDIKNGYYLDTNTIGTYIEYKTLIENYYNNVYGEVNSITIPDTFNLQFDFITEYSTKITWSKHALYNNISSIDFYLGINNLYFPLDINGGEKLLSTSFVFGVEESYSLNFNSQNGYSSKTLYLKTHRGEKFETPESYSYRKFVYLPQSNKTYALLIENNQGYLGNNPVKIIEFNSDTFEVINSTTITTTTNYFGDLTVDKSQNLILDLNSKSMVLDGNSLSKISEHNINNYSTREYGSLVRFRENTIIIDNINNYNTVKIYDVSSKKLLLSKKKDEYFGITLNGQFFSLLDKIYKIEGEIVTEIYETSDNSSIIGFQENSLKNTIYFNTNNNEFYEYKTQSNTATKQSIFDNLNPRYFNYLEDQNKFLVFTKDYSINTELHIIDEATQEIKSINLYNSTANIQDYFYFNNTLISTRGFYLKNYF
ncbi:hypothetical protein SAMN05216503_0460 [Polaribacter sp. KT25b]|uniref:hypothetical protein n=1 Tax=Polaribacter sp. KT25b TaxID=1855336 RepID=UPI00087BA8DE|nr:hypothetical protein [Polaribacter sp. KT25b]SDR69550.1 hypothetical protein SAMN05216503_0460 [Polaribacter sp. KT25b]